MGISESCSTCKNVQEDSKFRNKLCCDDCEPDEETKSNKKTLQPIVFSEIGSNNAQDSPDKTKEIPVKSYQVEEEKSTGQPFLSDKKSQNFDKDKQKNQQFVVVNYMQNQCEVVGAENYEPLSVPFSVIKLTLNSAFVKQINAYKKDFFKLHEDPEGQYFNTWKLQSGGFYSNFIKDGHFVLISEKYFYEGGCRMKERKFELDGNGILINSQGTYKGGFKNSKANGKGNYLALKQRKIYEGVWKNGSLTKGNIETKQFTYNGEFEEGKPQGFGKFMAKNIKATYEGKFTNGKFDDEIGVYSCPTYSYEGGFKQGKKHGFGTLEEKDSEDNKKKNQRRKLLKISGIWEADCLTQEQSIL